jgi:hypothetical protein
MTRAVPWALLATALLGCSSDDDPGPSVGGNALCAAGEYALGGTLAGEAISQRGTLKNHAWIQTGSRNTLDADFEGGGRLHTQWDQLVADGASIAVTGSLAMPPGGARSGVMLNAATGAQQKLDDEVRFELTNLSEVVTCVAPPCPPIDIEGTVNGCIHWEPIGP